MTDSVEGCIICSKMSINVYTAFPAFLLVFFIGEVTLEAQVSVCNVDEETDLSFHKLQSLCWFSEVWYEVALVHYDWGFD